MNKKVIYIILLVVILVGIIAFFVFLNKNKENSTNIVNTDVTSSKNENTIISENKTTEKKETTKTVLEDGTLYSLVKDELKADLIIGDNYFDTQINDIFLNPQNYSNKIIEIEGMFLDGNPYTFVGRFSTSNLCPFCPAGYSYMEYQWQGEEIELKDQETWIKVIGTLEKGNDETSYYQDYYYIQAKTIEVMNEKGQDTVNN